MPCCILVHTNMLAFCSLLLLSCEKIGSCNVLNNEQHPNFLHISGLLTLWVTINVVKTNLCIVLLIFWCLDLLPSWLSTFSSLLASFLICLSNSNVATNFLKQLISHFFTLFGNMELFWSPLSLHNSSPLQNFFSFLSCDSFEQTSEQILLQFFYTHFHSLSMHRKQHMTKISMLLFPSLLTISTNESSHKIHKVAKLRVKPQETKKPQIFKKTEVFKKTRSCWIWNVLSICIVYVLYMYYTQF
jgi:hypothetical protein